MKTHLLFALGLMALGAPVTGQAQEVTNSQSQAITSEPTADLGKSALEGDPWRFDFDVIGWGPAINGNVTVAGREVTVDQSLSDLLDDLEGIAMLGFELRKEKFGFYAQPNWIKLESDGNLGPLSSTIESELWIVDVAGFYQLHKWGQEKPVTLDALVGVRYWHINNELTVNSAGGAIDFNGSDSGYLIDPFIGLRAKMYFTQKFSLTLHGDVGGFDASQHSSDLSWQALGMLGYDFTRHFSLSVGYRAISVNTDSGSGANADGMDLILHGFLLGLNFHW